MSETILSSCCLTVCVHSENKESRFVSYNSMQLTKLQETMISTLVLVLMLQGAHSQDPCNVFHEASCPLVQTNLVRCRVQSTGSCNSASKSPIRKFVITVKAPARSFSWLKAATTAFTFKTLLRHYAKEPLTPRSLNVKLGPRRNYHKRRGPSP